MMFRTLLITTLLAASAAEAACPKWTSNVPKCQVYPQLCQGDDFYDLMFGQRRYLVQQSFLATPEAACDKLWEWYAMLNPMASAAWPTKIFATNDPAIKSCKIAWNGNLNDLWDNGSHVNLVTMGEDECALTPAGPHTTPHPGSYARPAVAATPGGRFTNGWNGTPKQRDWIFENGFNKNNGYGSDLGRRDTTTAWLQRWSYEPYEDDPVPPESPVSPTWDTSLQVDHILPRVDVYGCPCGSNGYNNALIISGSLNRAMSNDLRHPDRIAILQQYVPGYVAPQRAPFEPSDEPSVEPSVEESDHSGGCSTHTAGSGGILGVMLALVLQRRTRKGRPRQYR